MRQIGLAIHLYAHDNGGNFPDTLEQLLQAEEISPGQMICPASHLDESPGITREEQIKYLHEAHASYIYVGKGLKSASATQPILFELPENHDLKGVNILFGDNHVEWLSVDQAKRFLKNFVE